MSGNWTPGPWASVKGTTTGRAVVAYGQPKVRFNVANVGGPNREANARLIAAAPELLAALERAYGHIMSEAETRNFDPPVPTDLVADMQAAIARAKGNAA